MVSGFERSVDVVVIGAGVVGAACAYYAARAGLTVAVLDSGAVASGTTGAGEGNLLVSDKEPGPELDLILRSAVLWNELAGELGTGADIEYERKGGLVVAESAAGFDALRELAAGQRAAGAVANAVLPDDLPRLEPHLTSGLAGGMHYPQDAQVQPMLATAWLLRAARRHGARVHPGTRVTAIRRSGSCRGVDIDADRAEDVRTDSGEESGASIDAEDREGTGGRVVAVSTPHGTLHTRAVVNAAGTWGGDVARLAGTTLPIMPRRGFILVTEPLPQLIRHKVYSAEYVANVASSSPGLETSAVVEGTRSGTILIGASRERVGFDRTLSPRVLGMLAAQAVRLFPFLAEVSAIRAYRGFRPYTPDHLPIIGADARVQGLFHACGHEGAGVGLAPVTGHLIAALLTGDKPDLDLAPFRPGRFRADDGRGDPDAPGPSNGTSVVREEAST